MTELEIKITTQADRDTSFAFTFKHLTTSEAEAEDLGLTDQRLLQAYIRGYAKDGE